MQTRKFERKGGFQFHTGVVKMKEIVRDKKEEK